MREQVVHLSSRSYVRDGNVIWFSNYTFNGLFKFDLSTEKIDFVHKFENNSIYKIGAHSIIYKNDNELIFIPSINDEIVIYNIMTGKEDVIRIPGLYNKDEDISGIYVKGKKMYLFPAFSGQKAWQYDLQKKTLEEAEILNRFFSTFLLKKGIRFRSSIFQDWLIVCAVGENKIWKINLANPKVECFEMNIEGNIISRVLYDGKHYWILLEDSQDVYRWDYECNEYIRYISKAEEWIDSHTGLPYNNMLFTDSGIFLINHYAKDIMKLNHEKKSVEKAFEYPDDFRIVNEMRWGAVFSNAVLDENRIMFMPQRSNMMLIYEIDTGYVKGIEFVIPVNRIPYYSKVFSERVKYENKVSETEEIYNLRRLLLLSNEEKQNITSKMEIGAEIYSKIIF